MYVDPSSKSRIAFDSLINNGHIVVTSKYINLDDLTTWSDENDILFTKFTIDVIDVHYHYYFYKEQDLIIFALRWL